MANHVSDWLGAYCDGELHGARLRQIEQHLAECAACQAELNELRALSALLQEPAARGDFLPTERFAANLALSLPRQTVASQPRAAFKIGWWMIPVALLGMWIFIEITFTLSSVMKLAADFGLLGSLGWLQGGSQQTNWFSAAMNLFGDRLGAPGWELLSVLNDSGLFVSRVMGRLIPQAIVAVCYWGWLVTWWLRRQQAHRK